MAEESTRRLPIPEAMSVLRPNNAWRVEGDTWEDIVWLDDPATQPTKEEVIAKAEEIRDLAPIRLLRRLRDERLRDVDWVTLKAMRTGEPIPQEWKDYMQALADITDDMSGITMSGNELLGVNWPERPDGKPADQLTYRMRRLYS